MQFEKHDKLSFTCKHSDGALMDRVYKAVALPSARRDLLSLYKSGKETLTIPFAVSKDGRKRTLKKKRWSSLQLPERDI